MNAATSSMADLMRGYDPPPLAEIERLEGEVHRQLKEPGRAQLSLLGYGEVTIAVAHPKDAPRWACKRLPPASRSRAERFKAHIERYIDLLERAGIRVVPTSLHIVEAASGGHVLYLAQPILPTHTLGPNLLRTRRPDANDEVLVAVIEAISRGTTPRFGVDGQLANWAWLDDAPWHLDISTPFTQGADDRPELDVSVLLKPYPAFVRPFVKLFVVPSVLVRYYDLRPTLVEFAGFLQKEGLQDWIAAAVAVSNRFVDKPITVEEVRRAYDEDVSLWELAYRLKHLERRLQALLGRTYQFLISPPFDRYGGGAKPAL